MGSIDQEIVNPKGSKEKEKGKNAKGGNFKKMSTRMLTSPKLGRVTCPSKWTLMWGLVYQDPSLDHCKVTLVVTWVTSLNIGLGLTFGLTCSQVT